MRLAATVVCDEDAPKKDDSLLVDLKRFMGHLRDLCPEYNKELNILQHGLTERILLLFFTDDRPIWRLRQRLQGTEQGHQ